jgi:hypothetical protein
MSTSITDALNQNKLSDKEFSATVGNVSIFICSGGKVTILAGGTPNKPPAYYEEFNVNQPIFIEEQDILKCLDVPEYKLD